jgi:hypothetical protein
LLARFQDCLVHSVSQAEVGRAFRRVTELLIQKARQADTGLAERLARPLAELARSAAATSPAG